MRGFLSSGGRFDSGVRPANVWLLRSKVLSRTLLEFVLARSTAGRGYRSCGEVNDLIKGTFGEDSPSADLADGYLPRRQHGPELHRGGVSFDELGRQHGLGLGDRDLRFQIRGIWHGVGSPRLRLGRCLPYLTGGFTYGTIETSYSVATPGLFNAGSRASFSMVGPSASAPNLPLFRNSR
jgi:hypothetical protein